MDLTTILIALIVSVLAPGVAEFVKSWIGSRARQEEAELKRKEKLEDWVRQDLLAARAADTAATVALLAADVKELTVNTKDALVASTKEAALLQGEKDGQAAERSETHQEAVDIQAAKEAEPPVRT